MFKHILLATDGSAASQAAERMALELARRHGATLTALYVVDPYPYLGIGDTNPMGLQAYLSAAQQHAEQARQGVLALAGKDQPPLDLRFLQSEAHAADGILQAADQTGADAIVVGSHGRSGFVRLVLGSVAAKVVARSVVPVLVVPSSPHPR